MRLYFPVLEQVGLNYDVAHSPYPKLGAILVLIL
jgi:hypothetical protein